MLKFRSYAFAPVLLLAGCASCQNEADYWAGKAGLVRTAVNTANFTLTAYRRLSRSDEPLTVYIEGDGLAWIDRTTPSDDPTPRHPVGLMLAAADPGPNVLYLARPCQYTPMRDSPRCTVAYWTNKRFSEEVIESLDQAVDRYAERLPGRGVDLIGYSGGGALAILIAARRRDVRTIRTVAGNLDPEEVNRLHDVAPLSGSANPIEVARAVAHIPQLHFSGSNDSTVPPIIAERFAAAADDACVRTEIVYGMAHDDDWAKQWPALLAIKPACRPPLSISTRPTAGPENEKAPGRRGHAAPINP